jgi:hypothetical protein
LETRINQAKTWGRALLKEALDKYCESEGKNKRASKFHNAVRFHQGRASSDSMAI